jgi:hypothetical protein
MLTSIVNSSHNNIETIASFLHCLLAIDLLALLLVVKELLICVCSLNASWSLECTGLGRVLAHVSLTCWVRPYPPP